MLTTDIFEESSSPWCSPMMILKQVNRDGTIKYRFVVDFRRVNQVTMKDAFPLHWMDQAIETLGGAKYFSVIDMARGYYQSP